MLPDDAEFSTGLDLALLGTILLVVVGFARGIASARGGTPRLLRFAADAGSDAASPIAVPEMGLLEPAADIAVGPVSLSAAGPLWTLLTLLALCVTLLGPLWYWVGRPLYYRR